MCPLVRGPSVQDGFVLDNVSPWVGVSSGGGCPRPWVRQRFKLGLGVLDPGP